MFEREKENLERFQGRIPDELPLLTGNVVGPPQPVSSGGVNATKKLALDTGLEAFHKPTAGIEVATARHYGHHEEAPTINECAAWRLACELGHPVTDLLPVCVFQEYAGQEGSLCADAGGWPRDTDPLSDPQLCLPAGFWDSLIGQQDRHGGNWRWDGHRLTLIDHGYCFPLPRHILNYSEFVKARHQDHHAPALQAWEREALERLVASPSLFGIIAVLPVDRANAMSDRAKTMLGRGQILGLGEF
jgi:hypothetical protein